MSDQRIIEETSWHTGGDGRYPNRKSDVEVTLPSADGLDGPKVFVHNPENPYEPRSIVVTVPRQALASSQASSSCAIIHGTCNCERLRDELAASEASNSDLRHRNAQLKDQCIHLQNTLKDYRNALLAERSAFNEASAENGALKAALNSERQKTEMMDDLEQLLQEALCDKATMSLQMRDLQAQLDQLRASAESHASPGPSSTAGHSRADADGDWFVPPRTALFTS